MKQFVLILVGATMVFMVLAMAQEPETFKPLFFPPEQEPAIEAELPTDVVEALREFNSVLEHFYRYGGDERFLSHLAASDAVKDELRSEIRYLAATGVMQTLEKSRGSILTHKELQPGVWQLLTEEVWHLQYHDGSGTPVNPEPIASTITLRYVIENRTGTWTIAVMEPADV